MNNGLEFEDIINEYINNFINNTNTKIKCKKTKGSGSKRANGDILIETKSERFTISCKLQESKKNIVINSNEYLKNIAEASRNDSIGILITSLTPHFSDAKVVMDLQVFLSFLQQIVK